MTAADWPAVQRIYEEGIATGDATFETRAPDWDVWDAAHARAPRLVAEDGGRVVGFATLSPVSRRAVYRGVGEVSVYVGEGWRGKGIGRLLLRELIRQSEVAGFWTLQAGIFPENVSSIELHRSCGFREVGRRERIGQLGETWRDTVLMERRSTT